MLPPPKKKMAQRLLGTGSQKHTQKNETGPGNLEHLELLPNKQILILCGLLLVLALGKPSRDLP